MRIKIRGIRRPVIFAPAALAAALGVYPAVDEKHFRHEHVERDGYVWPEAVGKLTIQTMVTTTSSSGW